MQNDEIKEILDRIETASEIFDCLLKPKECTLLLDYITNLQQNYNDNVSKYEELLVKYSNIKQRIDKAIEYIENLPVMFYPDDFYENNHKEIEWDRTELLDFLQGDSDE